MRTYRFLRGDEGYKLRWADEDPGTEGMVLGGPALGGVAAGVVVALTSYAALAVVAALAALPLLVAASAAAVRPRAA